MAAEPAQPGDPAGAGSCARIHMSHSTAMATIVSNGTTAAFIHSHPAADTSAPDENDDTPITVNTIRSLRPCVLARSAGRYDSVRSVVPPVYMKFQPTPS